MSELEEPSMAVFDIRIDAHMHSKATSIHSASLAGTNSQPQGLWAMSAGNQDSKFAESRAVGGACFPPMQPIPFCVDQQQQQQPVSVLF